MGILFGIILFSFIIFIHELGHFMAAKFSGVQVNEFSLFMGPALLKWKKGETQYSIRCIPIGGYCAMEGEDEDTENPHSFQKAAWWKRLCILVAGSFMNLLTGIVIIAIVLACTPKYASPQIETIESWSSISEDGALQEGDIIKEFNGTKIRVYNDFLIESWLAPDGDYDLVVERGGKDITLNDVRMERREAPGESGQKRFGISFAIKDTTAKSVLTQIFPTAGNYVRQVFMTIKMLFTGQVGFKDLSGPVGIVDHMQQTAEASETSWYAILNMLNFGGLIAINLAVMNMLPFPALDGGRSVCLLLTTAVEKITRKKIPSKYEAYIHGIGMILLLILMAFVLFKDIFSIFMR